MTEQKQNLAEIAKKKRHLHLIEKLHNGKALTKQEIEQELAKLADELLEDIRQFTFGAEQYDDQTFVLMRVAGGETSLRLGRIREGRAAE